MIKLKEQYPYIDEEVSMYPNLVKHWAEDENGIHYFIRQAETGIEYPEAIDVFPCVYSYYPTNKRIDSDEGNF